MPKLIDYAKSHKFKTAIIAIIIMAIAWYWYKATHASVATVKYITAAVQKQTLVSYVSGTGQVEASNQMDIKPQTDGRLTSVRVQQNQQIKTGDIIAIIDQQSAANSVAQAKASLEQAQASYQKLIDGSTQTEIESQKLSIESAQQSLNQAKQNYDNAVITQQQAVDKAYSNLLNSGLEAEASDTNSAATITITGNYTGTDKGDYIISVYQGGSDFSYNVTGLSTKSGTIKRGLAMPIGNGLYITFSETGTLNSMTTWKISVPNLKASNYLSNLNAYNSALQTQKQTLEQGQNSIDSAQTNLDKANLALVTVTEPPTNSEIASAKAQITSAQAQLANAQTAYENTILRAPFDGVVAKLNFAAGDKVTAGSAVATMITKQQVAKITLNEVDAAKVKLGQKASMTFSAIPDLEITGKVADVDNIGTVSQNVVNFTVKIVLDIPDDKIKPGMSVSASVITNSKADVLTVPSAAVKSNSGQSYVLILVNGKPVTVNIAAGISNDTDTEISGNINEGDEVVTQTVSSTAAAATQSGNILQSLTGNRNRSTTITTTNRTGSATTQVPAGGPPQ